MASAGIEFFKTLVDNLYDGVYFVDTKRRITYWNGGAERLTGYAASEVVGRLCFDDLLAHVDDSGCRLCVAMCPLAATIGDQKPREANVYLRHKDGHRVPVSVRVTPIRDASGTVIGGVEVFSDSSELARQRRRAGDMEQIAMTDELTQVPNRRAAELRLAEQLRVASEAGQRVGVLMCDIDHFKDVNDTHGHEAGDAVLRVVAATLRTAVREGDLVARWGGEEFIAILAGATSASLESVATRCRVLVAESAILLDGVQRVGVTVSIGGAMSDGDEAAGTIVRRADACLYAAKRSGRNRVVLEDAGAVRT